VRERERAEIIFLRLEGVGVAEIATRLKTTAKRVSTWSDVPVFQVSLKAGYDPAEHLAPGRTFAPLRDEGVLTVGSRLSYHNLQMFGCGCRKPRPR